MKVEKKTLNYPNIHCSKRSSVGIGINMLDCDIIESEFELQSCYYIPFWYEPPYPHIYGLNSTTTDFL